MVSDHGRVKRDMSIEIAGIWNLVGCPSFQLGYAGDLSRKILPDAPGGLPQPNDLPGVSHLDPFQSERLCAIQPLRAETVLKFLHFRNQAGNEVGRNTPMLCIGDSLT